MDVREDNLLDWLKERMNDDDYSTVRAFLDDYMRGNTEYRESSEARINEYAESESRMKDDIQSLKARNYDLLMQIPVDGENAGDGAVIEDVDDDGTVYHIDNLFTEEGDNE